MVFQKKSVNVEEGGVHTGTEAWNIAQYFTGYAIALPLKDLNDLEDVARFGAVKLDDDLAMDDDQYNKRRIDAVKRYWQKLRQVVSDTMFKVKPKDKAKAQTIFEYLKIIPKYFDALSSISSNQVSHDDKLKVNEEFLILLLNKLVDKKHDYLFILDHAGLIFRESDEVNLDQIGSEFINGG